MKMRPLQKGFTLIELLVVVSIIAVLSAVGLTAYNTVFVKSRDSKRMQDLKALGVALELYYNSNNAYIVSPTETCNSANSDNFYETIKSYISNQQVPVDPKNQTQYCYYSVDGGKSYRLFATLENCDGSNIPGFDCQPATGWNYSVTSPDLSLSSAN